MKSDLNSVLLEGLLVDEPRRLDTAETAATFELENRRIEDKTSETPPLAHTYVHTILVHRGLAEVCLEHLSAGQGVRIVGQLRSERLQTASGKTLSATYVVADHVEFKPILRRNDS